VLEGAVWINDSGDAHRAILKSLLTIGGAVEGCGAFQWCTSGLVGSHPRSKSHGTQLGDLVLPSNIKVESATATRLERAVREVKRWYDRRSASGSV
jgi:hypothetical protein